MTTCLKIYMYECSFVSEKWRKEASPPEDLHRWKYKKGTRRIQLRRHALAPIRHMCSWRFSMDRFLVECQTSIQLITPHFPPRDPAAADASAIQRCCWTDGLAFRQSLRRKQLGLNCLLDLWRTHSYLLSLLSVQRSSKTCFDNNYRAHQLVVWLKRVKPLPCPPISLSLLVYIIIN